MYINRVFGKHPVYVHPFNQDTFGKCVLFIKVSSFQDVLIKGIQLYTNVYLHTHVVVYIRETE